ncbi:hypothetical protein [Herbaspirillum sp. YR522]|uniref:hypothetical protein n=1 Tax=Herbaspirillum sp. YR522 TaxID=1144342 RepID=UPI00026FC48D|nr:hypothetical protein [Herbaspirillum sp. YR522]EJN08610.1 hypothetical protein PMI40_01171 [Herbaspirillum sp. YR522]
MAEIRKKWEWFVFYLMASFSAFVMAMLSMDFFWPSYDAGQHSSGPMEQQFYLLLVDRGYWMTGHFRDSHFRNGMTREGRERFTKLLHDVRFSRDCLGGDDRKNEKQMECTVNGEWIYFVQ